MIFVKLFTNIDEVQQLPGIYRLVAVLIITTAVVVALLIRAL
jgi:hypothetical protein